MFQIYNRGNPQNKSKMTAIEILKDRGFNPNSNLNYCLAQGTEYYVGYRGKSAAIVSLMPEDESIYFIDKTDLKVMAETARVIGIEDITLYTNYGVEIHSKHENSETVGINRIIKIDKEGFNHK
jgi:hypothetical protein